MVWLKKMQLYVTQLALSTSYNRYSKLLLRIEVCSHSSIRLIHQHFNPTANTVQEIFPPIHSLHTLCKFKLTSFSPLSHC